MKSKYIRNLGFLSVSFLVAALFVSVSISSAADYEEVAILFDSAGVTDDEFGREVAIDGDTAVVGAPLADGTGTDKGLAIIYEKDMTDTWVELLVLDPVDLMDDDRFGNCVAISGDYIFVGAPRQDEGVVYVYENILGVWTEVDKLVASDAQNNNRFGTSCAMDGETAIIGAQNANPGGNNNAGQAYIFFLDELGDWVETQILSASDGVAGDHFGSSVDIDVPYVIVGAIDANTGKGNGGKAYIYDEVAVEFITASGSFGNEQILMASDVEDGAQFGVDVVISDSPASGLLAIVGANHASSGGNKRGQAYVFEFDNFMLDWPEVQVLTASDASDNDRFGNAVSISGTRALIGAPRANNVAPKSTGQVYQFLWDGATFTEVQVIVASDQEQADRFGTAVAQSGGTAIIGAPLADPIVVEGLTADAGGYTETGVAYIFDLSGAVVMDAIMPGIQNNINTIKTSDANPGGKVAFVWGFQLGEFIVPGPVCPGLELGIAPINVFGVATADEMGMAEFMVYIPFNGVFQQAPLLVQSVDLDSCQASDVLSTIIQVN